MSETILYLSTNDGTDTRINKEVRSLSSKYIVIFIGVASTGTSAFLQEFCQEVFLVKGKRNHPITLLRQILLVVGLLVSRPIRSIHVINEQLAIFFWPLLFFRHTVLDVFDSIFLTKGIPPDRWLWLKRMVYAPADQIIVTDNNRRNLMPAFTQARLRVVPNYPPLYEGPKLPRGDDPPLTLLFFGWLGMQRGGWYAQRLLEADPELRIIMLGWFSDEECRNLAAHPRVDYRGIIPQEEALTIAANEVDFILCVYEPRNLNTINASPNKIYDGIQTQTPMIINREVKVSALVEELQIGIVVPNYQVEDFAALAAQLRESRGQFSFPESLRQTYTWESVEQVLLEAHEL